MKHNYSYRVIRIDKRSEVAELLKRPQTDGMPIPMFERILGKFRSYQKSETTIEIERPLGHPELDQLIDFARGIGALIPDDRSYNPSQVAIRDYIVYSQHEKDNASLLECRLNRPVLEGFSAAADSESLGLKCALKKIDKHKPFGFVANLFHVLVIQGAARQHLEKANLKHLKLVPLSTDAPYGKWPEEIGPLYIIWSDYELPPVSMPLFDNFGNHYLMGKERAPKVRGGYYILDGYDVNPPLKYDHLDTRAFDIAHSYERFGGERDCYCKLVYSQRARKVLEELGMELDLRPVRLGSTEAPSLG